jgi:hypothetical protein
MCEIGERWKKRLFSDEHQALFRPTTIIFPDSVSEPFYNSQSLFRKNLFGKSSRGRGAARG